MVFIKSNNKYLKLVINIFNISKYDITGIFEWFNFQKIQKLLCIFKNIIVDCIGARNQLIIWGCWFSNLFFKIKFKQLFSKIYQFKNLQLYSMELIIDDGM